MWTKLYKKSIKTFKIREKLLSWQKIWISRHIATDIEEQLVNQGEVLLGGISHTYQTNETNENHTTEPLTVGYLNLRTGLERNF